ncbi:MAG TPA: Crp/Fnr family transcriptional regulator, partial [bacterium]
MSEIRSSEAPGLTELPIFADLSPREIQEVLGRAQRRTYRADETIFREGDPPAFIYYILSGEVNLSLTSEDRRINVSRLGAGLLLALYSIFDDGPQFLSATTVAATTVLAIPKSDVVGLLRQHPETILRLGAILTKQIRDAARVIAEMQFLDLPVLLAKRILELARRGGTHEAPVAVRITQEELSELTGATRGGVNRALKRLEQLGLVRTGRGRLTVLAP